MTGARNANGVHRAFLDGDLLLRISAELRHRYDGVVVQRLRPTGTVNCAIVSFDLDAPGTAVTTRSRHGTLRFPPDDGRRDYTNLATAASAALTERHVDEDDGTTTPQRYGETVEAHLPTIESPLSDRVHS